jgi:hypothetical protein
MYNFADLPWGVPHAEVEAQLTARGFELDEVDERGTARFTGRLFNEEAVVFAAFGQGGLSKINLILLTPDHRARDAYASMQQFLTRKYGPPHKVYEVFQEPYFDGDGYEETAISVGKATFSTFWPRPNGAALYVEITEELTVSISYESPDWAADFERRQAAEMDIL